MVRLIIEFVLAVVLAVAVTLAAVWGSEAKRQRKEITTYTAALKAAEEKLEKLENVLAGNMKLNRRRRLKLNVVSFPAFSASPQALGWFKREIKGLADFKGLKCRETGIVAELYAKMGMSVVNMPGGEIAAAAPGGPEINPKAQMMQTVGMMVIMLVAFYFILIRPQNEQRKKQEAMLKELKKGDKIVTSSGILATVITASTMALSSTSPPIPFTKERSIFSVSTGKRLR